MTDEVAVLVLRNNYLQSQAISTLETQTAARLAEYQHLIRSLERTANGHVVMLEVGGGWRLAGFKGFDLAARAGYGTARVRVPTEVVIEADQRFWNYGLTGMRKIGSRYVLRLEIRNVQFRKDFVPQTLGRANIIALGGWGIRF